MAQLKQLDIPAFCWKVPVGQLRHAELEIAAVVAEKVPATQLLHDEEPDML